MPKVDIWMPIFIGDYLRDTAELSDAEHGAYLLLLMHYWQKNGEIGCDVERLARVARTQIETARFILGSYFVLEDGNYKNKRADIEMENAESRRASARENGQKGGRPPKENPQETGGLPAANRAVNPQESSSPSPIPSYNNTREREEPRDDFTTRFERVKQSWNDLGLKPSMRKLTLYLTQDEREIVSGALNTYSDEEIAQAIGNYSQILQSKEHVIKNRYETFIGFLRSGVEKFMTDANPFEAFRVKPPAWEKPERTALDDRPDATSPEKLAQELEEAAQGAMNEEERAVALEQWTKEHPDSPMAKALARIAG